MTAPETSAKRSKSWFVIVPLALVVLLAVIWSGLWVYAANRAEHEIDAWVDREARLGRVWNCADRRLAGFPFRFELVCNEPTLETRGTDAVRITSVAAHAVAQIWAPNHIVAEFVPPARVEVRSTNRAYAATWSLLQMSGVGDLSGQPQRFSLTVRDPRVEEPADTSGRALLSARLLEFHARRVPGASGPDGVEYAFGLNGGESAVLAEAGTPGPIEVNLQGLVTAAADLRPMPFTQRLKAWADAGGAARLDKFAITTPKVVATARGVLALDTQGRLNGTVDLGFSGLDEVMKQLDRAGVVPPELSPVVGALAMVGKPGAVEGRKGVTFAVGFKSGTLRLGGFPVGMVPPLF